MTTPDGDPTPRIIGITVLIDELQQQCESVLEPDSFSIAGDMLFLSPLEVMHLIANNEDTIDQGLVAEVNRQRIELAELRGDFSNPFTGVPGFGAIAEAIRATSAGQKIILTKGFFGAVAEAYWLDVVEEATYLYDMQLDALSDAPLYDNPEVDEQAILARKAVGLGLQKRQLLLDTLPN